tara:strand:+ start:2170 stop:2898 length:729 start_codon:yes stop_codon:yes gene_type:complete
MAFKPLGPSERASIEAQVLIKAGTDLAIAEIASGEEGVAATMAIQNAEALADALPALKSRLEGHINSGASIEDATAAAVATVVEAFPEATVEQQPVKPTFSAGESKYIDDAQYAEVNKVFMYERSQGIVYGSQQSAFMDNQAIRKLFAEGTKQYPADYFVESMRGQNIPITKNGKCALGDFKIKRGLTMNADGTYVLLQSEGNHPLANKSGYFGGLVKHSPFTWGDRPTAIDPQGWLANTNA